MICECPNCDVGHKDCTETAKWYLEYHAVDRCKEYAPRRNRLCSDCFAAHINKAKSVVTWGMSGLRSPLCGGCFKPLTRLHSIIEDVGHA